MTEQSDLFGEAPEPRKPPKKAVPPDGRALRDDGIRRAIDHAGDSWADRANFLFKEFTLTHSRFLTEDVRMWAEANCLIEDPPDGRAWGAVAVRAKKAGLVRSGGIEEQKDPKCHRGFKTVWLRL